MSAGQYDGGYFDREYFELHEGKRRYFRYLLRLLSRHGVGSGPILDVGSGRGLWLAALGGAGASAFGLEHAVTAARCGPRRATVADAERPWPLRAGTFTGITLLDVIEHLSSPEVTLRACREALRPDGRLFVLTLSAWSLARPLLGRSWSYHLDPTHRRLYSPRLLRRALESAGLEVIETRTLFNFCVVGEGNPSLRSLRRIGRVVHMPLFGDSVMMVARPGLAVSPSAGPGA
jgi:SAM-dependent methyltransferase